MLTTSSADWCTTTTEAPAFLWREPQNTDFNAGKAWAFNDDQKKILSQVHDRISDQDCKDFINKILADNHVAKDRNTFDKLLRSADFNTYNEDSTDLGVSTDGLLFLRNAFNNDGAPAATYGDHIFFVKTAFLRATFNSLPALGLHNRNIDTATIVVHELLHVAGLNDPQVQNLNRQIHEHCGFTGMDY